MLKKSLLLMMLNAALAQGFAQNQEWKAVPISIPTPWAANVNPENALPQYPRPQMIRKEWKNLNGLWNYAIRDKNEAEPQSFDGKILVPYCVESSLSGVKKAVSPDQKLWYKTNFTIPSGWKGKKLLLHFDAVDYQTTVWVNGQQVGTHTGGNDPFSFDISKNIKNGPQEIVVSVWDPTDMGTQPRGKQILKPHGIFYTAVTGIWQTVWIEPVDQTHIKTVLPVADIDKNTVAINPKFEGLKGDETFSYRVLFAKETLAEGTSSKPSFKEVTIASPKLWTPNEPNLYQLEVSVHRKGKLLDKISSYFAMRKVSTGLDEFGYPRLMLNNKPVFQFGTLDQGWWPESLLTPPTYEAMQFDVDFLKKAGFNMVRKHIKVEPSRYYHYADSIGLLIWQDMVSGFQSDKMDEQYIKFGAANDWNRPAESAEQFEGEWKNIMDHLKFFPSIAVWIPFNEGWGQYETHRIVNWTIKNDPSRVVNGVSGWTDRKVSDVYDVHQYPGPGMGSAAAEPGRVQVLGEFGGLGLPLMGHLWNPEMRNWGYRTYKTRDELTSQYADLINNLHPMINRGLSAAVYTQTTDIEGEVNGLITYDRKEIKIPTNVLAELHKPLFEAPRKAQTLLEDSEAKAQDMLIMRSVSNAESINRNDLKNYKGAPMLKAGDDITGVKLFNLKTLPANLQLRIRTSGDSKIYLNGVLAVAKYINGERGYDNINLNKYVKYLKAGENEIRVESVKAKEASPFDFGLYTY